MQLENVALPSVYRHTFSVVLSRLGGWAHVHMERFAFARFSGCGSQESALSRSLK